MDLKLDKEMTKKMIIAGVIGAIIGIIAGFAGTIAFIVLALAVFIIIGYTYYQIRKGEIIEPYSLIEKIQYTAVGAIVGVIFYSFVAFQFILGIFLCIGIVLLALALIHAIRTDVLALDN
ncbi:hypothetical protein [Methanimicrococcus hongohii]|uniref:hypothetical protein n=1 Tax=Methanimicrococcus hongohii TaxID=3028295 RepID=UPI0029308249|nr:hypothetical protein [Methanimicrococcus sp. Hf6]